MSESDDMRDEYRLEELGEGIRGKYYERYKAGTNVVKLDDDVAEFFPNAQAVNDALRGLIRLVPKPAK